MLKRYSLVGALLVVLAGFSSAEAGSGRCAPPCPPKVAPCPPKCCYEPCITYCDRTCRKRCCENACSPRVSMCLNVCDPCCCDSTVKVPVCIPACCAKEAPCVSTRCGCFGRTVVSYSWSCGFEVQLVFTRRGDIRVTYF